SRTTCIWTWMSACGRRSTRPRNWGRRYGASRCPHRSSSCRCIGARKSGAWIACRSATSASWEAPVRIQLWSYNYDPEPTGIGIVSTVWSRGLRERGHELEVVAAHPHYPEPRWGTRAVPYREVRDGIQVL